MSVSYFANEIKRLESEVSRLEQKAAQEADKEAKIRKKILDIEHSITKHTSASSLRSKYRQIERLNQDMVRTSKDKANIAKDISRKQKELARKREQLRKAESKVQERQQKAQQHRERHFQEEVERLDTRTAELQAEIDVVYDTQAILAEVFVLESETAMKQGTCFNVAGTGLVTCEHVLGSDMFAFHPSDVTKKFAIEVVSSNPTIDLAKISAPGLQLGPGLPPGSSDVLQVMDKLLLAGYPNYRLGDTGIVSVGAVTGFRTVSSIRRILLDTPVIAGNSGGPVLGTAGGVVGIAVTGADRMEDAGATENHGVVPVEALAFL